MQSPCIRVEEQTEAVLLEARGKGHGYGLSLSYAGYLAAQGKDYEMILSYFFENMNLERKYDA